MEKIMDFEYREEYFKEYVKQNIIMAVLIKSNSHSVTIYRLIKKINTVKDDSRRKTDSNFWFFSSCLVLMRF